MATLSEAARAQIWRGLMRYWSSSRESMALDKSDFRAAFARRLVGEEVD